MAKELDKYNKLIKSIKKDIDDGAHEIWKSEQNLGQTTGVRNEGCKQLGLEIQRLKDAGRKGKTVYDFDFDAGVKAMLKEINNYQSQLHKEIKRMDALQGGSFTTIKKTMRTFCTDLESEIKTRKKKQKAKIDSKSLPDLEKLLADTLSYRKKDKNWNKLEGFDAETISACDKDLERGLENAIKQTKELKLSNFQEEMMAQALNTRVLKGNLDRSTKVYKSVIGYCTVAQKAIDDRQNKVLMENKVLAAKEFKILQQILDPYQKASKDGWLMSQVKVSKDKAVIQKSLTTMDKMFTNGREELTKIANARLDR